MEIRNKVIIVLISGGLDSATVAGLANSSNAKIVGLSFDYGQRHKKELEAAKKIARHFQFKEFKIIKLDLSLWGGSSLTDINRKIPMEGINANIIPNTYVPGRNTIFISIALSYAEAINADFIGLGVNALDYSGSQIVVQTILNNSKNWQIYLIKEAEKINLSNYGHLF